MSSDNGIYIIKFKDLAKITHGQSIDNIYYSFGNESNNEIIPCHLYNYFSGTNLISISQLEEAVDEINELYPYTEFGIRIVLESEKSYLDWLNENVILSFEEELKSMSDEDKINFPEVEINFSFLQLIIKKDSI